MQTESVAENIAPIATKNEEMQYLGPSPKNKAVQGITYLSFK